MTDAAIMKFIEKQFDKTYRYTYKCEIGFDNTFDYALVNSVKLTEKKEKIEY